MYPVLFRIGEFEITSFGVMVALAALVGLWLFRREVARSRSPAEATEVALWGLAGGLLGAKVLWVVEHLGEGPVTALFFARGGLSWYGGLIGGVGTGLLVIFVRDLPLVATLAAATPPLAFGHLLGRIGCFLVGDDYGRPSGLPWAVAFPEGLPPTAVPVHPTQLYEALFLGWLGWILLRWRRCDVPHALVLGRYLLLAGAARFAIEFIRVNQRVALGLSVAQWASLAIILTGAVLLSAPRATPLPPILDR